MVVGKILCIAATIIGLACAERHFVERDGYCDENTLACKSLDEVSELLDYYRAEAVAAKSQLATANCSVCNLVDQPCYNGGTCVPLSTYKFACQCPFNYTGTYCQIPVVCGQCGVNAECKISNHRANCFCKPGYTGNPYLGCFMKKVTACATGDPHFRSYDKNYFDYQGTCPYVFTQNCKPINGYQNFSVKAKNKKISETAHVSYVSEVEVYMRGITIHVDESRKLYVNGIRAYYNYYNRQVSVLYNFGEVTISSIDNINVVFKPWSLCVSIPDIPDFNGPDVLCGLAGNRDNNCQNDLTMQNGTIIASDQHSHSVCREADSQDIEWFGDTWITEDFLNTIGDTYCEEGHIVANRSINCNLQQVYNACSIIHEVETGDGPFGICIGLGNDTVDQLYQNCVYDVCYTDADRCTILASFAQLCQSNLPFTDLGNWRPGVGCPGISCPAHSSYTSCASSCQPTCSNPNPGDGCVDTCTEGCTCDPGYVVDASADTFRCIPVEDCGCTDSNSNYYPPNTSGLLNNCTQQWTCQNGTLNITYHACGANAVCNLNVGSMTCECLRGYAGDGYNCTDINECLDPTVCNQNTGHGNCTNTPGSYYCTCARFYDGDNCQYYRPKRHCADLYVYNSITATGAYNIYPPYSVNGHPPLSPLLVYCDMDTQGGGWTLLGNSLWNSTSGKTYSEYVRGFGDPNQIDAWLGLEVVHGMTNDTTIEQSMKVDLHRCARNGNQASSTYCTYPKFVVLGPETQYSVFIPEECNGTEQEFYDGWVRWNPDQVGPKFVAFDNDHSAAHCSQTFRQTGWWYYTDIRCGSANLNGDRYNCSNPPDLNSINTYLQWGGSPLDSSNMYLRPRLYPNYDHQ